MIKSSYSYENNLLKEIKQIHKGDYILTKKYKYIDGKLVEFTELDPFLNLEKRCVYDYDESTNLKSITEFRKYTDRKSGKITDVKTSTFFRLIIIHSRLKIKMESLKNMNFLIKILSATVLLFFTRGLN